MASGGGAPSIWNFFEKSSDGSKIEICNHCRRQLSYKTTITNLKSHLKQKHVSAFNLFLNSKPNTNSNTRSEKVVSREIEARVGGNNSPCDSGGGETDGQNTNGKRDDIEPPKKFRELCILYALNPNYEIPDRKTLSVNLLPKVYEKRLEDIKSFVQINAKSVCITVDSWTSRSLDSYMAITAHFMTKNPVELKSVLIQCGEFEGHHTGIRIYRDIRSILQNWGIYDKVNFFVSDNASNMLSAAKYFEDDDLPHFGCYAHKLNLVVQDALDEIKDTLAKVQKVVNHFRKSTIAKEKLLKYQSNQQNVAQPKTVIKAVPTRWNSVFLMLERFIELAEALRATIPNLNTDLPIIPIEEWKCIEQVSIILKPFYKATVEMSAENYLVASKAIILTSSLINICDNFTKQELYDPVKNLAEKLKDAMLSRLGNLETNETICLSTVLDPRFKLKAIKNKEQIEQIKNILKIKITNEIADLYYHHHLNRQHQLLILCHHKLSFCGPNLTPKPIKNLYKRRQILRLPKSWKNI
ncbi:unnamed protein product [Chilo suppressalis]|uniref:BED-type domain-containing protein n=1 Tax=Chilo suppressalis TaxID=168631 RepID=A0ABN8ATR9_CHISP|nr:unnamed protein product [Chilo suppressalis]